MNRLRHLRWSGRFHYRPSLRTRLTLLMLVTSLSLIAILVFFYHQTEKALHEEFERRTAELSRAVQIGLEGAAGKNFGDPRSLEGYLSRLNSQGVREISVISSSNRIVASTRQENVGKWITERRKELIFKADLGEPVTGEGQLYNVVIPVVAADETMGYIHLTLNTEDFSVLLRLGALRRAGVALAVIAAGTLLALLLAGMYTRPIEQVVDAAARLADGDLDQQLPTGRRDEIGALSRSFNYLADRLRRDRDLGQRLRTAEHLASVGQFARSIAHEIKNPLNFISLSIDHMRDAYRPGDAEKAARFESLVTNIKGEIRRIGRFAESFLEYGRPFELRLCRTPLAPIIAQVLELAAARAEEGGVRLETELESLPELDLDPEFIRTCLTNLTANALEAMPAGGVLRIETRQEGGMVRVTFADSGVGVDPRHLDQIFQPFFTTKEGGLGLGLALTRRIVEEHGGKVRFDSRPGEGSVVTLQLPVPEEVAA